MVKLPGGDWLTVAEVAKELGVGVRRVQKLIQDKRLPAIQVGERAYLVLRDDVKAFKKKDRPPGRPKKPE